MKSIMAICALLAFAVPVLHAQQSSDKVPNQQSRIQLQENHARAANEASWAWYRQDERRSVDSLAKQTKLRQQLATTWQALGMSPQGAKMVADAYRVQRSGRVVHTSLAGKSADEVSAMLRAALAKKNYQQANQLLIDYERARLSLASTTLPNGVK